MAENSFEIVDKVFFYLLLLLPLLGAFIWWRGYRMYPYLKISSTRAFSLAQDWVTKSRGILWVLRFGALACIIIALARPRDVQVSTQSRAGLGVDIAM
ncbi:MAG: BatA domain-containing protein, partial [Flavobacteriales bacterium]|nr:BatA domain-containing protein [Flavobacteriales bacterium]